MRVRNSPRSWSHGVSCPLSPSGAGADDDEGADGGGDAGCCAAAIRATPARAVTHIDTRSDLLDTTSDLRRRMRTSPARTGDRTFDVPEQRLCHLESKSPRRLASGACRDFSHERAGLVP